MTSAQQVALRAYIDALAPGWPADLVEEAYRALNAENYRELDRALAKLELYDFGRREGLIV